MPSITPHQRDRGEGQQWWARVPVVADAVDLHDLRALPPGGVRRSAVIERMRTATDAGSAAVVPQLEAALRDAGVGAAAVRVHERLWIDGSAILEVRAGAATSDVRDAVERVLRTAGAKLLDRDDLPPATGPAPAPPVDRRVGVAAPDASTEQWYAGPLGFDAARRAGLTGEGVRVAVVDSGVDPRHPELAAALGRGASIDRFAGSPITSGHGTFVASLVAGAHVGVAPGVDLTSSRTYGRSFGDHRGEDEPSRQAQRANATRALQDALAPPDGRRGADVLVTSWGILDAPGVPARDYDGAMATLAAAGAVVVAAAGNDGGGGSIAVPAQLDDVLAVGGVGRSLAWHPKASTGPSPRTGRTKPDLAAPVVDIRSAVLGGGIGDTMGQGDGGFAGTSAAAPLAAGLVALLAQAVHDRHGASPDIDEVRSVLPLITRDVDAPGPDPRTGAGVLDASRLDEAARAIVERRSGRATGR